MGERVGVDAMPEGVAARADGLAVGLDRCNKMFRCVGAEVEVLSDPAELARERRALRWCEVAALQGCCDRCFRSGVGPIVKQ
jgi:hypothetical protein